MALDAVRRRLLANMAVTVTERTGVLGKLWILTDGAKRQTDRG